MEAWIATDKNGITYRYFEEPTKNVEMEWWDSWDSESLPKAPAKSASNHTRNGRMNL
jgi:hypothetical protein